MMEGSIKNQGDYGGPNYDRVPDMPELNRFFTGEKNNVISLKEIVAALPKSVREKLTSGYDMKNFAKIFEDEGMMQTVNAYLSCGMNVSETSRELYMHRNTLMYRLKTVKRLTGLDLKNFDTALTFKLLHSLYLMK